MINFSAKGMGDTMTEMQTATTVYRDCPHCKGEGFVTVHLEEDSPLLDYLEGDRDVLKVCPHCVRRGVVPAAPPKSSRRSRDTLGHSK